MKRLIYSLVIVLASISTQAATCPTPDEVLEAVQIEGSATYSKDLTNQCANSVELARNCQQAGMDEYNNRMAISAQRQCENDFMKAENFRNKNFKKTVLLPYTNLKYSCEVKNRHVEYKVSLCKATVAQFINSHFNLSEK